MDDHTFILELKSALADLHNFWQTLSESGGARLIWRGTCDVKRRIWIESVKPHLGFQLQCIR